MATHHGKEGTVKISTNVIAETYSWEIEETVETVDDTVMGDPAKTHLVGIPEWTGRLSCNWDEADTNGQVALTIGTSIELNLYPMGDAVSAVYLTGTASVTRVLRRGAVDGKVEAEFEFMGNGVLDPDAVVSA